MASFNIKNGSSTKTDSYLSVIAEKSNCEHLWRDHGLVWKKVSLLPVVKGELTPRGATAEKNHLVLHTVHTAHCAQGAVTQ